MNITYFFKVLLQNKKYILSLTLIAILTSFVFLSFKKAKYKSVAQYATGFTTERVKLTEGFSSVDIYNADVKFNNAIETFKSPKVTGILSYTLLLHDLENPQTAFRKIDDENKIKALNINVDVTKKILRNKISNSELLNTTEPNEQKVVQLLKLYRYDYGNIEDDLTIKRVEGTDYINITFSSENPELSAAVVNTLGQVFTGYYKSLTAQHSEESASNIKDLVNAQQRKVDSLDRILLHTKISQGTIDPVSVSTNAMQTVKDLESRLAEAKSNYYSNTQRLNYLKAKRNTLSSATSGISRSNEEVLGLMERKRRLVFENAKKGGNDPVLQAQIEDINNEIVLKSGNKDLNDKDNSDLREIDNQINEAQANANAASATIRDYETKIAHYTGLTNINPGSGVIIDVIQKQLDIENRSLQNIKEKYNQAIGLAKDNSAANIRQTLVGQPAVEPEPSRKLLIMGLSGISVLFLSSLFFILIEIFNTAIKRPSALTAALNLPVLGAINKINLKGNNLDEVFLNQQDNKGFKTEELFKQHLRKLRFELDNSGKKIFLITSTSPKQGKTTLIQALAHSFLLSNRNVLLVDANFSNNELTRIYNANPVLEKITLSNNSENLVCQYATKTKYKNLQVIGCAGGDYTPSEVLKQGNILEYLFSSKANGYDYVLIEAASMNQHSDAKELIKYSEGLIAVFSANSTISSSDIEEANFIRSLHNKYYGAVLNEVKPENIEI